METMSDWCVSEAKPADSGAIASLFAHAWISPFTQLQFGHVKPQTLAAAMAPRIAQQRETQNTRFIVARHLSANRIASVAQWVVPLMNEPEAVEETQQDIDERQRFEDEAFSNRLPENSNISLITEF